MTLPRPVPIFLTALVGCLLATARPATAQATCDFLPERTPASAVPELLWGELRPADVGQIPSPRDSTDYNEFEIPRSYARLWTALDIEEGWLFAGYTHGLQVWDARGINASNPQLLVTRTGPFTAWSANQHTSEVVKSVDAPPGNSGILAVGVAGGLNVFDTSSQGALRPVYADLEKNVAQVYSGHGGGRDVTVAATTTTGILFYDLTAAATKINECVETTPAQSACGVYLGRLGNRSSSGSVDGENDSTGEKLWVAVAGGGPGVELWDLSDPTSPIHVVTGLADQSQFLYLSGVALWRSGASYYLGVRTVTQPALAQIYDVSCIATDSCSAVGAPIWSQELPGAPSTGNVTFSRANGANGQPFLYYSAFLICPFGEQQEWLFDVSSPGNPVDITPPPKLLDGAPTGYWGWYYRGNPTGFNQVRPGNGKFFGQYFYRAAFGLLDVHVLEIPTPPSADFTYSPAEVYAGQTVAFFDTSSGGPSSWSWSFQDGTPPTSSAPSPSVQFPTVGTKMVSLVATNDVGPSAPVSKNVPVLDPAPAVGGIAVSPAAPIVCQPVTLTATGATGQPPVTIGWEVRDGVGTPVASGSGNPFVWRTESATPGSYTAAVELDNAFGPPASAETPFTLAALAPLPASGSFTPTSDPPLEGTVQFHVSAPGATEFCWDFGDGAQFPAGCLTYPSRWSKDPLNGPSPSHTYPGLGTYPVTVRVRNCFDQTVRTSAVHEVDIISTEPLVASFQATSGWCFGSVCSAEAGQVIDFNDSTTGSPTLYEYDWDGDGTPEQSSSSPVGQHVFSRSGVFTPTLTVHRGGEFDTYEHPKFWVTSLFDDSFESGDLTGWSDSSP